MEWHSIIGIVAGFGTTFAAAPNLIAMFRRGSAKGMNPTMAGMMGTFQIVWVYYGFLIDSMPVVLWNIIAVGINFLMVGAFFYFVRKEKMGRPEARSHGQRVIGGPGGRDAGADIAGDRVS
jgi:uncharacterized protein with PQ loop repeat